MKLKNKDIENLLKKEIDDYTPDVYHNVKTTPLHSLLKGEAPEKAFKKTLITMLLASTLLLVLVLAFSLIVYFNATDAPTKYNASYVQITIEHGTDVQKIGIIANTNGEVICAVDEVNGTKLPYYIDVETIINSAFAFKTGDRATVIVLSDNNDNAMGQMIDYAKMLRYAYGQKPTTIIQDFNSLDGKDAFVYLVNKTNDSNSFNNTTSIDELAQNYIAYVDTL